MTTLLVLAMVVIVVGLLWSWWSGRIGRDPSATVDHFHRALTAMSPEDRRRDRHGDRDGGATPDGPTNEPAGERDRG